MTKKLAVLLALLPIAALAQGPGGGGGRGQGPGGPGSAERMEKMERRARLARNLGLAEVLDLDTAQATKLADALAKVDEKRVALHRQTRDSRQLLRRAAEGEKVSAADVDAAIAKLLDLRAQAVALDKEMVVIVTKDLSPEKKARAALFLARFGQRISGPGGPGMGMRHGGPGMGPGMGMEGPGGPAVGMGDGHGPGMGRGGMGPGPGGCENCPWDEEDDQR